MGDHEKAEYKKTQELGEKFKLKEDNICKRDASIDLSNISKSSTSTNGVGMQLA
jgi:hypothetical protein